MCGHIVQWLGYRPFKPAPGIQIPLGLPAWAHSSVGERLLHTQEVAGSNPAAPTSKRGEVWSYERANSSAGRAPALHAGGHRFESCFAHLRVRGDRGAVVQWFRTPACQAGGRGFKSRRLRHHPRSGRPGWLSWESVHQRPAYRTDETAGIAQLVEHWTENPGVPSSNLGPGTSR